MGGAGSEQKVTRLGPARFDKVKKLEKGDSACTSDILRSQRSLESKFHLNRNKGVELIEKENMNPRDINRRGNEMDVMNIRELNSEGVDEDLNDNIGMCIESGYAMPTVVDGILFVLFLHINSIMMKILIWNCRGAANKGVATVIRNMKKRYRLYVVVILEPRISGGHATKVIRSWGFNHSTRVEADGFSGGIWILWESEDLCVDILLKNEQFIHCKLGLNREEMIFTTIYASPNVHKRDGIWSVLQKLASETEEPWLLAGDFNEIKTPMEQKGGGRTNIMKHVVAISMTGFKLVVC
ncbi:hypothetical protein K1719_017577 [Acacia pycnantha]|nr:hypothetical protein K1719_017577 [Acacia pycnantha]